MAAHPPRRLSVLIHEYATGGGMAGEDLPPSWAAEGGAMRVALAREFAAAPGVEVVVTLDPRIADDPGSWAVERVGPGEEAGTLARWAGRAGRTIAVAPETGGILHERARIIERAGGRSLGSTPAAIALAGDKLALARHLAGRGIATPPTREVVPSMGLPRDAAYPAVLKPRDGAGSLRTYYLAGPDDLPEAAAAMTTALLQPFVPGVAVSCTFLAGGGMARLLGVGRQAIARRGPRLIYEGGTVPEPDMLRVARVHGIARLAVESIPGLRGLVGVDLIEPVEANGPMSAQGRPATVLEINPRPTTSIVGMLHHLGPGTLAQAWLAMDEGREPGGDLARRVHRGDPTAFRADGTILGSFRPARGAGARTS